MTYSSVKHKRGTSTQWASSTYVLKDGEIGIDKTLNKIKIGNGSSLWPALAFINVLPTELTELAQDAVELAITAGTGITKSYNDTANTITLAVDSTIADKTYVDTAISGLESATIQVYIPLSLLGQVDGVAELDSDGLIPDSQIPSNITRDTELSSAISTAINNLVDGAPAALDTLNELAAAINDDASYASTITTALGTKEPLLPSQTGNSGKFLTTDGTSKSWSTVAQYTLPDQTSNSGKFLTTNGTLESWATVEGISAATQTALDLKLDATARFITKNTQSATYAILPSDLNKMIEMSGGGFIDITDSASFGVGFSVDILQTTGSQVTIRGVGTTVVNGTPGLKLRAQWSSATLIKRDTDLWVLIGDLSP
jgi:hypothetical protein